MAGKIIRVTMFKLPSKKNQLKFIDLYKVLVATARKVPTYLLIPSPGFLPHLSPTTSRRAKYPSAQDSKPYIISLEAGPTEDDARNQGYTFAAKSEFASLADMKYYDTDCAAHKTLKEAAKGLGVEGFLTVFYEPQVIAQGDVLVKP